MVEAIVKNGSSETTDYAQSFPFIVSPALTALFEELKKGNTLTAGQKVIYAFRPMLPVDCSFFSAANWIRADHSVP